MLNKHDNWWEYIYLGHKGRSLRPNARAGGVWTEQWLLYCQSADNPAHREPIRPPRVASTGALFCFHEQRVFRIWCESHGQHRSKGRKEVMLLTVLLKRIYQAIPKRRAVTLFTRVGLSLCPQGKTGSLTGYTHQGMVCLTGTHKTTNGVTAKMCNNEKGISVLSANIHIRRLHALATEMSLCGTNQHRLPSPHSLLPCFFLILVTS